MGTIHPSSGDTLLLGSTISPTHAELLFSECDDIAAIVLEPMMANAGCVVAKPELPGARRLACAAERRSRHHG